MARITIEYEERSMIQGRVRAGLARAKSDGKKLTSDARRHGKGYLVLAILLLGLALSPRLGEEARFLLSSWVMSEPQLLVDHK
jgi:DNA invertase Pin-like site-specific DNA recombinase